MSKAAPAIPLFGDAYLADTHHLTLEEHGAYLKLLMIAWRMDGCALPDDDMRLAKILGVTRAKWAKLKPVVLAFWTLDNGRWFQGRLSKERSYVETRRITQSQKAHAKWETPPKGDGLSDARKRSARLAEARQKGRHDKDDWAALVAITGNQCVKCHATGVELVKDHILPIYLGGSDALSNLQPLCIRCNSSKGADATDYRLSACNDLFERLPNACPTLAPPPPPPQVEEERTEATPQSAKSAVLPIAEAQRHWNENARQAGWPTVTRCSGKRLTDLRNRLRAEGLDGFVAAIARARASPLLGGTDPPHWFTFDFIVNPTSFDKVMDGNYDNRAKSIGPSAANDSRSIGAAVRFVADG